MGEVSNNANSATEHLGKVIKDVLILIFMIICFPILLMEIHYRTGYELLRYRMKHSGEHETILIKQGLIENMFRLIGIDMCLGWNNETTENELLEKVLHFSKNEYIHICGILEKAKYSEDGINIYEKNLLDNFYNKIYTARKTMSLKNRIKLRYGKKGGLYEYKKSRSRRPARG